MTLRAWHAVCAAVYVYVSYRLFQITATLKTAVIPNKAGRELIRNVVLVAVSGSVLWVLSALLIRLGGFPTVAPGALVDPLSSTVTRL
jgi:hypothetical protein